MYATNNNNNNGDKLLNSYISAGKCLGGYMCVLWRDKTLVIKYDFFFLLKITLQINAVKI